jgi:hypothetical protein
VSYWLCVVLALLATSLLSGAALYDAVVLAPNLRGGPTGLEHGRLFMSAATPARFFRVIAPGAQILVLASLGLSWFNAHARWALVAALVVLIVTDIITFRFHYPRNRLLLTAPLTRSPIELDVAARQWSNANLLRVMLVLVAWFCLLTALMHTAA